MALTDGADDCPLDNALTRWITRWRKPLLCLPIVFLLLPFNGKWRVGLDSSIYRGLALNLAHGKGYTFGDWGPRQVYPGYPVILAGIEKLFGPSQFNYGAEHTAQLIGPSPATVVSIVFNLLCAGAVLWLTHSLLRRRYALWTATVVTVGVGCSRIFVEEANSLMTDMPFLAAIMLALWGWDGLQTRAVGSKRIGLAAATVAGMVAAALLRPMFWILLVAWLIVCIIGLIRGPRRGFYALCLLSLMIIGGGTALMRPFGYEHEAHDVIFSQLPSQGLAGLYVCLHDQLPYAMFGEQLRPVSILGSVIILGSTLLLLRRQPLWTLLVFGTFLVTILLSDEPRYWLMILPILMLSWLMLTCCVARRFGQRTAQLILLASIALVGLNNCAAFVPFFSEQHRSDFMAHYKRGDYMVLLKMAEHIHERVRPDQKVLGPSGSILSIFSGVHVYSMREVMPRGEGLDPKAPATFAKIGFDYVIFPSSFYRQKEALVQRLIDKHIILQRQAIYTVPDAGAGRGPMVLATARFSVPPGDWRKLPKGWRPPTTRPVKHIKHPPTTRPKKKKKATTRSAPTTLRSTTSPGPVSRPATTQTSSSG